MRSNVIELVGGQQPLAHTHDMEMWLRLASFSDSRTSKGPIRPGIASTPGAFRQGSTTSRISVARFDAFETLFRGVAGSVPEISRLDQITRHTLATEALEYAGHQYDRGRATGADGRTRDICGPDLS